MCMCMQAMCLCNSNSAQHAQLQHQLCRQSLWEQLLQLLSVVTLVSLLHMAEFTTAPPAAAAAYLVLVCWGIQHVECQQA